MICAVRPIFMKSTPCHNNNLIISIIPRKGAQQYNFTTNTWIQLASLGPVGFQYFGCVLLPNTQDKILINGDLNYLNPNDPIIFDVPNNTTIPVKHTSNPLQMSYLVSSKTSYNFTKLRKKVNPVLK